MLVFTRKVNQTIVVSLGGERVTITLARIRNDKRALIGVDAPQHIVVNRGEVQAEHDARAEKDGAACQD